MDNNNQLITSRLEEISRSGKYSHGISLAILDYVDIISRMKEPLINISQMKGLGENAKKIILGVINELPLLENEENDETFQGFISIHGVSREDARKYITKGYTSPQDLLDEDISDGTKNYITRYDDFLDAEIPYEELKFFHKRVLVKLFNEREIQIVGGYRRGDTTLGKIEILLKDDFDRSTLPKLVKQLQKYKYVSRYYFELSDFRYSGAAKILEGTPFRHITITVVNRGYWGTNLLVKTGPPEFVRKLNQYVSKKGLEITEDFLIRREKTREDKFYFEYEESLFERLGIEYIEPKNRNSHRLKVVPIY